MTKIGNIRLNDAFEQNQPIYRGLPLGEVLGRRIRRERKRLQWTQQQFADQMAELGFAWRRITVAEIEGKRSRSLSLDEVMGVCLVFQVPPMNLVLPEENEMMSITPTLEATASDIRGIFTYGQRAPDVELYQLQMAREVILHEMQDAESRLQNAEESKSAVRARLDEVNRRIVEAEQVTDQDES